MEITGESEEQFGRSTEIFVWWSSVRVATPLNSSMEFLDSLSIESSGKIVKVGDTVMLCAENTEEHPYVARVENIISRGLNAVEVRVRWYYRPEESIGGRQSFHGEKELFLSDHFDIQSAHTILDTCTVHSFEGYTKLDRVSATDYYCRFAYEAATGNFSPETVRVHCICEMPYNPDVAMLNCEGERCGEWFHLECMNLNEEEAKELEHFYCPDCQQGDPKIDSPISKEPDQYDRKVEDDQAEKEKDHSVES